MKLYGIRSSDALNVKDLKASDNFQKTGIPYTYIEMLKVGAPKVKTDDHIVAEADMKVGEYTIANQPDVPCKLNITHAVQVDVDDLGTIEITGTNVLDEEIMEVITPVEADEVITENIFKTVTKVEGKDWVVDDTADKIKVGVDNLIGLNIDIDDSAQIIYAVLGTEIIAPEDIDTIVVGKMPTAAIDVNTATYDGTKVLYVFATFDNKHVS